MIYKKMAWVALLLSSTQFINTMDPDSEFDLSRYVLPNNSIRGKLDEVFKLNKGAFSQDPTWKDLNSFHWLIGQLTTSGGNTKFIVKAATHPAGVPIYSSDQRILPQIHGEKQNLSRLKKAWEAKKIIKRENLDKVKVVDSWIYHLPGSEGIPNKDLKDTDAIIVEEKIKPKSEDSTWCVGKKCQADVLKIDRETYNQIKKVGLEAKIVDLHPGNIIIDEDDTAVLFDLEDLTTYPREQAQKSNFFVRLIKTHTTNYIEKGSTKVAIGLLGQANINPEIASSGSQRILDGILDCTLKAYAPHAFTLSATFITSTTLAIRHLLYTRAVAKQIKAIKKEQAKIINSRVEIMSDSTKQANYLAVAKEVVQQFAPSETRDEILQAFAVIGFAKKKRTTQPVEIFGTHYESSRDAIKKMTNFINSTWCSDRSIRSKIKRGILSTAGNIKSFYQWVTSSKPSLSKEVTS